MGERREGKELSFIPLFTEYNTGQERGKEEPWFCDMSANPVTSGAVPGMLQNALRFSKFADLTLSHHSQYLYQGYIPCLAECPGYSFWVIA